MIMFNPSFKQTFLYNITNQLKPKTMFQQLERKIIGKLVAIKNKQISAVESGVGKLLNSMKEIDLPAYENLLNKYKEVVSSY